MKGTSILVERLYSGFESGKLLGQVALLDVRAVRELHANQGQGDQKHQLSPLAVPRTARRMPE